MKKSDQETQYLKEGIIKTKLTGYNLLNNSRLNKGTAFTDKERDDFSLHGLLPPQVSTLQEQQKRRYDGLAELPTSLEKYSFLRGLQDNNETLFYSLIINNIEEMLPIVYTPVVGEGCQKFSEIFRKPRGLFLSYPNKNLIDQILSHPRYDLIKCIVVSDGERILGLGDQGAGGMGIPIGKMALYTALAGIPPQYCLPILLDVGTDNEERLADPLYVGWRHNRVRGAEYDEFVDTFVSAVKRRWPHVLLQWEDFAGINATRLLARYRDQLCTFNDDIQGTAAMATGTLLSAINVTGIPLNEQKIVFVGFGGTGHGIAQLIRGALRDAGLSEQEAAERIYAVDRYGLLVEGGKGLTEDQADFARKRSEITGWQVTNSEEIGLLDVVRNVKPTALIGVSAQQGAFTEEVVRTMAKYTDRPVIFPLSNPTSHSEAIPQDLLHWTEGRALIGTGSPFEPVKYNGKVFHIDQTNNSYIFPGLALGIISSKAKRVSDGMIKAAALALAECSPARENKSANLLPPLANLRSISLAIAKAVGKQAILEGLAGVNESEFGEELADNIWEPVYKPYQLTD
ncbi:NAD-dependent malic enzyme [Fluoribacter gormanii]|uniref:NAD-dependent malic enzyme n=1 Tax=Fluoribacter gormanii TaxID=464 RepID=A0A377GMK6_9GAMM|nr:NAD-dependent malic enzyme [Fluoribacter gormanii]KTD05105.1 malate dehydrogenase [Fluoribacter gormanii]MCW8445595.1 NAD-dependent malic enzyme [Fluoribacter gormanii]MCW8470846.1 NAD-dependent malic enzyme [Fluoribacter gormanii]SIQ99211.1 NAD-dependent malic enzyme [Fluoribacter gormanii]STO26031.1 NAD-dependent malic enzyme [Fluoribacter gormanii]